MQKSYKPLQICLIALASMSIHVSQVATAQDRKPYLQGEWKDDGGARYEIELNGEKLLLRRFITSNFPRGVIPREYKQKSRKFRILRSDIEAVGQINPEIPLVIRQKAVGKKLHYRAVLRLGKRDYNNAKIFDEEKLNVRFIYPKIKYTIPPHPQFRGIEQKTEKKVTLRPFPVCGPDVTTSVIKAMEHMYRQYHLWPAKLQTNRCDQLFKFTGATNYKNAWDIIELSPGYAIGEIQGFKKSFPSCARPRWPCGLSVTFLGTCVHFQILNYVQWGTMGALCKSEYQHRAAAVLRNMANDAFRFLTTLNPRSLSETDMTAITRGQILMISLGEAFVKGRPTELKTEGKVHVRALRTLLSKHFQKNRYWWANRPEGEQCKLSCSPKAGRSISLKQSFSYKWGAYESNPRTLQTKDGKALPFE
jgi:hypothetical protein